MKTSILFIAIFGLLSFLLPSRVYAVCPVCTVAVGLGVGLSRYLGIDDTISGLWIGGLILSSSLWLASWMEKKRINLPYRKTICVMSFYILTIFPLYLSGIIGHAANTFWGIDKLLIGILIGSVLFIFGVGLDKYVRKGNNGKVYIYYQKVILPVSLLVLGSLVFFLITG